jgi:hypothetical protein
MMPWLNLSNIWIGTDNIWMCLDQIKCYMEWKVCDKKFSRPIWSTIWNRTDDGEWCHDLIWGAFWIGANVK